MTDLASIDNQKVGHAFARRRERLGFSLDEIEAEIGIGKSTLSRIERGIGHIDTDTLVIVCRWLRLPARSFVSTNSAMIVYYRDASTIEKITATLDADPALDRDSRDALVDLMAAAIKQVT